MLEVGLTGGIGAGKSTVADELARQYPQVKVIHHPVNRGYGGALRTGFGAARGQHIQTMDSDLSHEPEVIQSLAPKKATTVPKRAPSRTRRASAKRLMRCWGR